MEVATVKAAKFHSWAVGHPIDCELTVIEHDWVLLQRRDTGPGVCLGHSEHRCSVAIEGKTYDESVLQNKSGKTLICRLSFVHGRS